MFFTECKLSVTHPRGNVKSKINRASVEGRQTLDDFVSDSFFYYNISLIKCSPIVSTSVITNMMFQVTALIFMEPAFIPVLLQIKFLLFRWWDILRECQRLAFDCFWFHNYHIYMPNCKKMLPCDCLYWSPCSFWLCPHLCMLGTD